MESLPWLPFPTSLEANDAGQERSTAVEHAIGTSAAQADCRVPISGYDRLTAPKVRYAPAVHMHSVSVSGIEHMSWG